MSIGDTVRFTAFLNPRCNSGIVVIVAMTTFDTTVSGAANVIIKP